MTGSPAVRGSCGEDVCLTCSDQALPYTVLEIVDGDLAWVAAGEGREEVSVALVDAAVGDVVLVHAGEAIALVPPALAGDP